MAVPFSDVLQQELTQVDQRRSKVLETSPPAVSAELSVEAQAPKRDLAGMGVSGGGIRSHL